MIGASVLAGVHPQSLSSAGLFLAILYPVTT
jgi:hypothetical protein